MLDTPIGVVYDGPVACVRSSPSPRSCRLVAFVLRRRGRRSTSSACARWAWAKRSARRRPAPRARCSTPPACRCVTPVRHRGHVRHQHRDASAITPTSRWSTRSPRASPPACSTASSTRRRSSASIGRAATSIPTQLTRTGHAAGLSLSLPLGDHFILGATAKYLHLDTTGAAADGHRADRPDARHGQRRHLRRRHARAARREASTSALIGYNLWDHGSRESPLSLGIGARATCRSRR